VTVHSQMQYVRSKDLGFDKNNLLALSTSPAVLKRFDAFKTELKLSPAVQNVSLSGYIPGRPIPGEDFGAVDGSSENKVGLALIAGDEEFAATLGLQIIQGQFFTEGLQNTHAQLVINQAAARKMNKMFGWDSVLGKMVTAYREVYSIIGVLRDFHFDSLHKEIVPLALLRLAPQTGPYLTVRTIPGGHSAARAWLERTWQDFAPEQPYLPASFASETDRLYRSEQRTAKMMSLFACLSIAIGCLGLFGLAAFTTEQRSKEIGIRKVLGAAEGKLAGMLIYQHIRWVLAANIIAWPTAYIIINKWLANFAFRTEIKPLLFLASGGIVFLLACLTVFAISIKAATADPVKILKYE